jgi:hypothetical protein
MHKLEQYLDQVCRSIGGPPSMRQHVRRELREHLLDAVDRHKAAGLPEEQALAKALEEFGQPEEVRSELEAAHGQRMLAVVIDKALAWKERTMRAKWLWATWAYLGLLTVIALEVLFITFLVLFIVPKFQLLLRHGMIDQAMFEEHGVAWMPAFLNGLKDVTGRYTTFLVLGAAALWGLFEWRVHSENKSLMRLAALGTAAVGLMVVIVLAAGSMVVSFSLAMPAMGRMARPYALEQLATIDTAVGALEQALAKKDWEAMQKHVDAASGAMHHLAHGPAVTSLTTWNEPPTVETLRAQVKAAHENLRAAQQAITAKDAQGVQSATAEFRKTLGPVRETSRRPAR